MSQPDPDALNEQMAEMAARLGEAADHMPVNDCCFVIAPIGEVESDIRMLGSSTKVRNQTINGAV